MLALEQSLIPADVARKWMIAGLAVGCVLVSVIGLTVGGVDISYERLIAILFSSHEDTLEQAVIWQIRMPRLVLAVIVGAGLGACGAAMQAIFRNPLADPGLIGISSGAALGAISTIVLGSSLLSDFTAYYGIYAVPIGAFLGCLCVCSIIYRLSSQGNRFTIVSLLLAGIAVNAIVGAVIGILTLISSDQQLRDLTFWSMGSLAGNSFQMIIPSLCLMLACCFGFSRLAQPLNLYLLGEQQAKHLGVDVVSLKKKVFAFTALCTGAAVALTGIIGFVGFIVPHIVRLLIGPDHRYLLPASMLGGAILLCLADLLARTLILPSELPIGLITSALGGPFFLIMLVKTYRLKEL
ncbi:iron ABC transporter permease [Pseudoalteromonas sp. McH1-7]|uniref:FecCD family ABC transporter permease n=1 Tax=unclassified Pseudoalteromonas TaxID=194690 RepID=UPI000F65250F|nr:MULTISPECIES: iron ABC transporter permease [unclassified Pseudoalteromonas]NUZ11156.1 iron ABC transporter permease [Pseudoalteromonas sp. McH1-7]RRS08483.1 iron ABC transporter permease [Pseudoalteromonas sp. J010]RXF04371.1 iron ABC transporter permease [Pseudoalteromonas sp. PS5]USD30372.1 iron ABC transporter permease [Pseudoalteromonas sp. SCSIO 43201]